MVKLASRKVCRKQGFYPRNIKTTGMVDILEMVESVERNCNLLLAFLPKIHALLEVSQTGTSQKMSLIMSM